MNSSQLKSHLKNKLIFKLIKQRQLRNNLRTLRHSLWKLKLQLKLLNLNKRKKKPLKRSLSHKKKLSRLSKRRLKLMKPLTHTELSQSKRKILWPLNQKNAKRYSMPLLQHTSNCKINLRLLRKLQQTTRDQKKRKQDLMPNLKVLRNRKKNQVRNLTNKPKIAKKLMMDLKKLSKNQRRKLKSLTKPSMKLRKLSKRPKRKLRKSLKIFQEVKKTLKKLLKKRRRKRKKKLK